MAGGTAQKVLRLADVDAGKRLRYMYRVKSVSFEAPCIYIWSCVSRESFGSVLLRLHQRPGIRDEVWLVELKID